MSEEEYKEQEQQETEKPKGYMDFNEWVSAGKDPDQWRDLDEWKRKGEEFLPFVQKDRDQLKDQVGQLQNDIKTVVEQQEALTKKREQEAYDRAKREYEDKLKQVREAKYQALEDMDGSAVRKAEAMEDELKSNPPEPPKQPDTPQQKENAAQSPQNDPDFQAWHNENKWWGKDRAMSLYASDVSIEIQKQTGLQGKALYDKVTEAVKQEFPHKFQNQRKYDDPGSVEGGAPASGKSKKKGYKDLPQEAKDAYKKFITRNPKVNKERLLEGYVNEYFPEG